ncbi:CotY/CotZ family spore coat protein [Virgibacillus sp. JSM 102003]|uniref:CotY/CotZ family spore coat protein n=1 Tax=Virgibacillus sp. JSM 102003 TaxID=1562108 RepID=UPI0035BF28CB
MGCGCNSNNDVSFETDNCACRTLRDILAAQDANNGNGCTTSCARFALSPASNGPSTIPFVLTTKANTLFYAFGNITSSGTGSANDCFISVYFKVRAVDEDCCAVLEILEPNNSRSIQTGNECCVPLEEVCDPDPLTLTTTGQCVTVDLNCICSVQCFDPSVVSNN